MSTSGVGPRSASTEGSPLAFDDAAAWRAIADDTYDWESWMGRDGRPLWVNPAVERMTGYTVAECLAMGDYPLPIVHEEDRERIRSVLEGARGGSSGNDLEFRIVTKDGGARWLAMSWQATHDRRGSALGFRTSVRDIDDRKRLELGLSEALRRAEAADRTRSEFLAMMSHELRSPLHSISGYAELMAQLALPDSARRFLDVITSQSQSMLRLVDDLLEMSALERVEPKLALGPTHLGTVAGEVVNAMRPLAVDRGLELSLNVEGPVTVVRTDGRRVAQVLTNLVGNAIKFTPAGSVVVRYRERPIDAEHVEVHLSVEDTGIGLDAAEVARAFEPFTQLEHAVTRRFGGVGLGLAISQRLARLLGAELSVQSAKGVGSTFELSLPVGVSIEPVRSGPSPSPGEGRTRVLPGLARSHPLSILVVDDALASRELLREMLELHGYTPVVAASGMEALERAREQSFDLAILDYHMPVIDGPTLARALRRQSARMRIVALTADVLAEDRLATEGFDQGWIKPLSIAALQQMLSGAAQTSATPAPRTSSVLDERVLDDLKSTRGRDGLPMLARIGPRVASDVDALWAQIGPAVLGAQHTQVAALAHSLKGHCLMVGARASAEAAEQLEDAARGQSRARSMVALEALERAVVGMRAALDLEIARSRAEPGSAS